MAKLVPKLNLNRTPQTAENGSLVYAKNIKLNKDGTIGPDYDFSKANVNWGSYRAFDKQHPVVGYIVGLNNKVYYFVNYENIYRRTTNIPVFGEDEELDTNDTEIKYISKIIEYDELTNESKEIKSSWTYHNGTITGFVTTNQTGEEILTICESSDDSIEIPIKHINLSHPEVEDESLYTQNPIIPITNLHLTETYSKTIPNGVYQFFVRYKISDNFYTPWIPCSKECFAGVSNIENTCSGSLKYIDTKKDSSSSFVFAVEHLFDNVANYESFQIGFILSHDDEVVARTWKEFNFSTNTIYFDYDKYSIKEIDIDEFLKANFEIFNVKNATFFRNKCYISNYKETDFNPQLQSYASSVSVSLDEAKIYDINEEFIDLYFNNQPIKYDEILGWYPVTGAIYGSNYTIFTESTPEKDIISESDILEFSYIYDYDINPDLAWINEAKGVIKFNYLGDDYTRYLTWAQGFPSFRTQHNVGLIYTDETHPLEESQYSYFFHAKWFVGSGHPTGELKADDRNFKQQELINFTNEVINTSKNYINRKVGNILLTKFQVIGNNSEYIDIMDFGDVDVSKIDNINGKPYNSEEELYNDINLFIQGFIEGFVYDNSDQEYVYKGSFTNYSGISYSGPIVGYHIEYSKFDIKNTNAEIDNNNSGVEQKITISATRTNYSKNVSIKPNQNLFETISESEDKLVKVSPKQYTSLMPFTNYKFYIHYVKNNGIITNGFEISGDKSYPNPGEAFSEDSVNIIYPKFSNVTIPEGYVAYFISVSKTGDDICRLFNRSIISSGGKEYEVYDCIEADLLLYNLNNNITIIDSQGEIITSDAIYCSSGCTNPMFMFGNSGSVIFELQESRRNITNTSAWIKIISKKEHMEHYEQLVKITPYIKESSYSNYYYMNLPAHLCKICKIIKNIKTSDPNSVAYYFAGNDAYKFKDVIDESVEIENITGPINLIFTNTNYVLSNFNLNYLALTEDVNNTIRTYNVGNSNKTQIVKLVNTLTSSDIYELPQMYKEYTRKYFNIYNSKNINKFTNTIRSSDTNTDEVYRNIFTFYSGDYYNVPCNRGPIVNMFSIADSIYVHCEHSLYKFSGNTSLNANNGDVQTKETDVFDSGIKELFDSEFGYGGIQRKTHSLISYFAYVFYDEYAKKIYYYGGENQLSSISDNIEKILNTYNIEDIVFVDDYHNNRFFVNLKVSTKDSEPVSGNICLSYSYVTKSFISIHDIDFIKGFCTRHNTYFLHTSDDNLRLPVHSIYKISDSVVSVPAKTSVGVGNIYKGLYEKSLISVSDFDNYCCIDVIFNENYEIIKNIEKVSWICSAIKSFTDNNYMAEEELEMYPGDIIQIYTDQCCSDKTTLCENKVALPTPVEEEFIQNNENYHYTKFISGDAYDAINPNIYRYPRFNCGIWSFNYFRDIRNTEDKFNYGLANDKSLIYGKYFVVRFAFGIRNCKIENINIIVNNYDKV